MDHYVDGSSNSKGSGGGIVLTSLKYDVIERAIHYNFKTTNNEAENTTLVAGLTLAKDLGVHSPIVKSDS